MTQHEEECIKFRDQRIMRIVIDQWKLYAYYAVRVQTHKNIAATRLFTLLCNRKHQVKFDALHRLTKYGVFVKQKFRRRIQHQQKLSPSQRYEQLALGLDIWCRTLRTFNRKGLIRCLLKWRVNALYAARKEEIEQSVLPIGK